MRDALPPGGWDGLPLDTRRQIMETVIQKARDSAANALMMESLGGPNDIVKQATDLKRAAALNAQAAAATIGRNAAPTGAPAPV